LRADPVARNDERALASLPVRKREARSDDMALMPAAAAVTIPEIESRSSKEIFGEIR
jgi:hypothetical protein